MFLCSSNDNTIQACCLWVLHSLLYLTMHVLKLFQGQGDFIALYICVSYAPFTILPNFLQLKCIILKLFLFYIYINLNKYCCQLNGFLIFRRWISCSDINYSFIHSFQIISFYLYSNICEAITKHIHNFHDNVQLSWNCVIDEDIVTKNGHKWHIINTSMCKTPWQYFTEEKSRCRITQYRTPIDTILINLHL